MPHKHLLVQSPARRSGMAHGVGRRDARHARIKSTCVLIEKKWWRPIVCNDGVTIEILANSHNAPLPVRMGLTATPPSNREFSAIWRVGNLQRTLENQDAGPLIAAARPCLGSTLGFSEWRCGAAGVQSAEAPKRWPPDNRHRSARGMISET